MGTKIELPKELVQAAFTQRLQSLDRSIKQATNKLVAEALTSEKNQLTAALATMTEVK